MTEGLAELDYEECRELLRSTVVGRIAMVVNDYPIILPVNYRMVETSAPVWLAVRTRPGNVLDEGSVPCAFEIDGIDLGGQEGWSVLVRGTLHRVDPDAAGFRDRFDPEPWVTEERDRWLVIEPYFITGRKLTRPIGEMSYNPDAYL